MIKCGKDGIYEIIKERKIIYATIYKKYGMVAGR